MKYCPPKYLRRLTDPNFKLPEWDYIESSLNLLNWKTEVLLYLFGVSNQEFCNWKKSKRNIPLDKIVIICGFLGITLDQFYERDFSEEFRFAYYYKLSKFRDLDNCKQFTFEDMVYLFDELSSATICIEFFPLGHFPPIGDDQNDYLELDFEEVKYMIQSLDLDVHYWDKSRKENVIECIKYNELCSLSKKLNDEWGDEASNHLMAFYNKKYLKLIMLSENQKFLNYCINEERIYGADELLDVWEELKKSNSSYDEDYAMAKILLASGGKFKNNKTVDIEKTMKLCEDIIKKDVAPMGQKVYPQSTIEFPFKV